MGEKRTITTQSGKVLEIEQLSVYDVQQLYLDDEISKADVVDALFADDQEGRLSYGLAAQAVGIAMGQHVDKVVEGYIKAYDLADTPGTRRLVRGLIGMMASTLKEADPDGTAAEGVAAFLDSFGPDIEAEYGRWQIDTFSGEFSPAAEVAA